MDVPIEFIRSPTRHVRPIPVVKDTKYSKIKTFGSVGRALANDTGNIVTLELIDKRTGKAQYVKALKHYDPITHGIALEVLSTELTNE